MVIEGWALNSKWLAANVDGTKKKEILKSGSFYFSLSVGKRSSNFPFEKIEMRHSTTCGLEAPQTCVVLS